MTIRPWSPADTPTVRKIMKSGIIDNIQPAFVTYCCKSTFIALTFASSILISAIIQGSPMPNAKLFFWSTAVALAIFVLTYSLLMVAGLLYFHLFCRDLDDIGAEYMKAGRSHFWVAELDQAIVGIVALVDTAAKRCDNSNMTKFHDRRVAWLRRLAVVKDYRRCGVAQALVDECVKYCHRNDFDSIQLITTEMQEASMRLFKRLNFTLLSFKPYQYAKVVTVWTYEFIYNLRD